MVEQSPQILASEEIASTKNPATAQGHLRTAQGHLRTAQGHLRTAQGHLRSAQGHLRTAGGGDGQRQFRETEKLTETQKEKVREREENKGEKKMKLIRSGRE